MDPNKILSSLSAIITRWSELRGDRRAYPRWHDFSPDDFTEWFGWVCLYEIEETAPMRLKARLVGSNIVEMDGTDITEKYLNDLFPNDKYPSVYELYSEAIENMQPVLQMRDWKGRHNQQMVVAKLVLPLADDFENPTHFAAIIYQSEAEKTSSGEKASPIPI